MRIAVLVALLAVGCGGKEGTHCWNDYPDSMTCCQKNRSGGVFGFPEPAGPAECKKWKVVE